MPGIDISICIVTFQAKSYLRECLASIYGASPNLSLEIIVVDNNSQDGTVEMLRSEFPDVYLIRNDDNYGFTGPINQALRMARGRYLMILNNDTIVHAKTIELLGAYLDDHPEVGIVGPKVLNLDGTFQKPCRRGDSRPWNAFSYAVGLSALFPKRKFFSGYLMTYMDEDQTHPVDGVSGSCMLIRREVVDQIGYLDERFFAYQEDADYCLAARKAGWQVVFHPEAQITHYGGRGGSRVQPFRSIVEWHKSYWLYYRKNFAADYFFLFNWLFYLGMGVRLVLTLVVNSLRRDRRAGPSRE
jgi:GT2 family glycosyltransferase